MMVGVDPKGCTRVDVEEGKVEVTGSAGGNAMVGPGQTVKAAPGGTLGPVIPTSQAGGKDPFCDP